MTGVGLDTKSVNHSMHKEWLDCTEISQYCPLAGGGRHEGARQPQARPTTSRVQGS